MKGFHEIRGQIYRTSYDAITGEFTNVLIAPEAGNATQEEVNPSLWLVPKSQTVALRPPIKRSA
jgi:hypothetical protein